MMTDPHINDAAPDDHWYVVHAQVRNENRAALHLLQQGHTVFCPRLRTTIRHARKVRVEMVPLFPGYLFVRLDITRQTWRSINGTRGVIRLVTQGDHPSPMPDGVVEALQSRTESASEPQMRPGELVRIAAGPFVDLVGKLEGLDGHRRVRVLLELLGRSVVVGLEEEDVAPAA